MVGIPAAITCGMTTNARSTIRVHSCSSVARAVWTVAAFAVALLTVAQTASAQQPRWGRERVPNQGACFYEDAEFRGDYFCVRQGDRLTQIPNDLGDEISSVRVFGNAEVTVFRDSGLRGRSARFINDVRDLKREGWGDQISSLDVVSTRNYSDWNNGNGNARNNRGRARGQNRDQGNNPWINRQPSWGSNDTRNFNDGACFYEDTGFRGQSFCVPRGATYASLPREFNDRISSVRVFGNGEVVLFQNDNFRGRSQVLRGDVRDLSGNWRDNVSSIRVF